MIGPDLPAQPPGSSGQRGPALDRELLAEGMAEALPRAVAFFEALGEGPSALGRSPGLHDAVVPRAGFAQMVFGAPLAGAADGAAAVTVTATATATASRTTAHGTRATPASA